MLLGKWEAAIADLSTSHTLYPTDPVVLIERAAAKHHVADYAGSIHDYNMLQQLQPLSLEQLVNRARLKEVVGDDDSSSYYWKVVLHALKTVSDLIACANAKFAVGSFVGSLHDLDLADTILPGQREVLKLRGIVKFTCNTISRPLQSGNRSCMEDDRSTWYQHHVSKSVIVHFHKHAQSSLVSFVLIWCLYVQT